MLEGPIPATAKILERNGMKIDDIDLIEINEAFARSSPRGGASITPTWIASTSMAARWPSATRSAPRAPLITTLLHELERSDKEIGFVTMCAAGGHRHTDPARLRF